MSEERPERPAFPDVTNQAVGARGPVFQVGSVHGDVHLGAVSGPPTPPAVPRQILVPVCGLVGRADELARQDDRLAGGGIARLTGMAGVGKTALAVNWARRARAGFPGGQLYVDLRGYGPDRPLDAHDVLAGFLRALGFALPAPGAHPRPRVDPYARAAATDGTPASSTAVLRALTARHLVTETESGSFVTHDLVRAYARELGRDERDEVLSRLYDYYLDTADRADDLVSPLRFRPARAVPPGPGPAFPDREAALAWLDAALPVVVALCTSGGEGYDDRRWRLAYAVRGYLYLTKRLDAWMTSHAAALAAAVRLGDRRAEALPRTNLGMAFVAADRLDEADEHC